VKHVKFHLNRFLRRVRIHGGEFDTSARAMYRVSAKGSLMSYEKAFNTQAELRIVRSSTIERKQMSTKTTFKRIALVTVAALGFGVMSVVPSNAATQVDTNTLSAATATMQTGETSTAQTITSTFLSANAGDTISVTAYLTGQPVGNTAVPVLTVNETTSAFIDDAPVVLIANSLAPKALIGQVAYIASSSASASFVSAKMNVLLADATTHTTAKVLAGTYKITFAVTVIGGGGVKNSTNTEMTITVTTNPALDTAAASVTSYILPRTDTTTAEDAVLTASKSLNTDGSAKLAGHIKVTQLNAAGLASTESITVTIAGPGTLGQELLDGDLNATPAAGGRAITLVKGNIINVFADGSSGVSTITLTSAAGKVLATETITFYGAATAIKATVLKNVVGVSAGTNAVLLSVTDASGTQVSNLGTNSFYVTSDKTTSITGTRSASVNTAYSATNGTTINSPGYIVDLSAAAIAAGTASLTFGTCAAAPTATDTCVDKSNAVSVRVGSLTPATVAVTLDKTSYIPGEKAKITVSLKDKDGLALADGTYTSIFATGGIASSYSLGAGSDTTTATTVHNLEDGVIEYSVYMPVAETDVKFSWTTGSVTGAANTGLATAAQAKAGSVTVAVASTSGAAASAAAEEATAAANDATDAALSAAEAAEAATAMAQEAVDAVAELSASVTKLISALRAQITTLTNLVVKIQKKVKA